MARSPPRPSGPPRLRSISVTGFQGSRSFTVALDPHVNFLFGKNGCGKTTLINLINAGLRIDLRSLFAQRFERLAFTLSYGTRNTRELAFERHFLREEGQYAIRVSLSSGKRSLFNREYKLSDPGLKPPESWYLATQRSTAQIDVWSLIDAALSLPRPDLTWLSVQRSSPKTSGLLESVIHDPVDDRLEDLIKRTAGLLSSLDNRSALLDVNFQREYILSLIDYDHSEAVRRAFSREPISWNFDEEEANIRSICEHLGIASRQYDRKISSHFQHLRADADEGIDGPMRIDFLLRLVDTYRLHQISEQFQRVQERRKDIYRPKDTFLRLMNSFYVDKKVSFDTRNQPAFALASGDEKQISVQELSSGEKQIYIILSEALNQENRQSIYLADEPEISLHVAWQEMLVESIMDINGSCQIIFATHSPDILGQFGDRAINMESL